MVRPWDESYQFEGRFFARPEHAPVAWVGDNRRDWIGLARRARSHLPLGAAGYVVLGSDLGGYLDRDDRMRWTDLSAIPFDPVNFATRWTAVIPIGAPR
jgi:alpha-glucosidase (family GH31 glycosyl hydrolase)